jgi:FKBP-type peptidyl-prolyl cis-trans isomerase
MHKILSHHKEQIQIKLLLLRNKNKTYSFKRLKKKTNQMKIKTLLVVSSLLSLSIVACSKKEKTNSGSTNLSNMVDSFSFAAGFNYGLQLKERELTDINFDALINGMKDAFEKDSGWFITPELYEEIVKKHLGKIQENSSEKNVAESKAFIADIANQAGVQKTESGMYWKVLREGQGPSPTITDSVIIHLRLEFPDDRIFEDTRNFGQPITIPVRGAWPGMVEGLQMMRKGAQYEFYVPYEMGFGKNPPLRGMPPNKALIYHIELFDIKS